MKPAPNARRGFVALTVPPSGQERQSGQRQGSPSTCASIVGAPFAPPISADQLLERLADLRDGIEPRALVVRLDLRGARRVPVDEQRLHERGLVSLERVLRTKQRQHQLVVLLDAAAQLSLLDQPRDHGRHFGGARPVVPRRADHLGRKGRRRARRAIADRSTPDRQAARTVRSPSRARQNWQAEEPRPSERAAASSA